MKKIIRTLIIASLILGISISSCKSGSDKQEPSKMEAVMAVHDEVMPKMSEIGKLVSQLKPLADSTENGLPYLKAMTDLQAAHASMMDWMKGFGDRFNYEEIMEGKPLSDQKQAWILEEEVKVNAMRDQINTSIAAATSLLK
ncbi:MAG: hypothetical protein RLZZ241_1517 [Bacteroidota bacterium]|jgi:hypothetical protein